MKSTEPENLILSALLTRASKPVSRIAPTPSGFLHAGNALSFLLTWLLVRRLEGFLHLRIDDLDAPRFRPECLEDLFRQLDWLGLDYDAGPDGPTELHARYTQSLRIESYETALQTLCERGKLYACRCSRKEYLALSSDGLYPGPCRNLSIPFTEPHCSWRIRIMKPCSVSALDKRTSVGQIDLASEMGDSVLRRRDGLPAYQIASLIEDLDSGCNLIVRGADLYPSSLFQCHLSESLGHREFKRIVFLHHPLLKDESGRKLSKTGGALALKNLRQTHDEPGFLYCLMARWLRLPSEEINDLRELQHAFLDVSLEGLGQISIGGFHLNE